MTSTDLHRPLIVGAYAALPPAEEVDAFYARLADEVGATGVEIPSHHVLAADGADLDALAGHMRGRFTGSVVTAIPGTMGRVGADARFGLASPDAEGRAAAVAFARDLIAAAGELDALLGGGAVRALAIHSAPSLTPDIAPSADAFARSLDELADAAGGSGIGLVIEHCDAARSPERGEKRFLGIDDEIALARERGLGISVNWGRSAIEDEDPSAPERHLAAARAAGVLEGLVLSGAGDAPSAFGAAWADAHLPLAADEPTSLLDAERVRACLAAAGDGLAFVGVKMQVPPGADLDERIAVLRRAADAVRG